MSSMAILGLVSFAVMIVLIILGVPIAISMFAVSMVGFYICGGTSMIVQQMSSGIFSLSASYTFAVVPLFMIVGILAGATDIASGTYTAAKKWVGKRRGGLLNATIVANALFGACSGISMATTSVFCKIAVPELNKAKYDESLTLGCVASASCLSSLIPPSIPIITVCILTNISIGNSLVCATLAGILTMLVMILVIKITQIVKPEKIPGPTQEDMNVTLKEKVKTLKLLVPILLLFLLIVGGSFFGWFAATVGGAVAMVAICIYALARRMPIKELGTHICDGARMFAGIYLMIMAGQMFSRFITLTQLASEIATWITQLNIPSVFVFLIAILFFLFCGCFISVMPIIVITAPIILPLLSDLGFDPYAMAICLVLCCELGNITPPVGNGVFATAAITGERATKIFKGVTPFFIAELATCILIGLVPQIVTWLPTLLGMM